jgi:hypothetical protein
VQLFGAIDPVARRIDAIYVEAGSGTYNGGQDIVEGHVVGRTGAVLDVLGHSNSADHGEFQFNTLFTVNAAGATVLVRGLLETFDLDVVNVGQRVRVFGVLTGTNHTADILRLEPTRVLGFANGPPQGVGPLATLTIDLVRVELRSQSAFAWDQSGGSPPDPLNFTIRVGNLADGLGIDTGTPVEASGFFTPVSAGGPDFAAFSLVNRDLAPSLLVIHDRDGGMSVTTSITPNSGGPSDAAGEIRFTLSGTAGPGEFTLIDRGFVGATPLPADPEPTVVPNVLGLGLFVIRDRALDTGALFLNFGDFALALDALLLDGAQIYNFGAIGTYTLDVDTNQLEAGLIHVVVN